MPSLRGRDLFSVATLSRSVAFSQAENRLHAQKALLAALLTDGDEA